MFKTAVALAFIAGISTSHAQQQQTICGPIKSVVAELTKTFGELPVLLGKTKADGINVLITGTPNGKSWSILMVRPDGIACFMASGTDMKELQKPQGEEL